MERTIKFTMRYDATIVATIEEFNRCANFFLNLGFEVQTHAKRKLQSLGYQDARKICPTLQSSLVQGARDCAHDMLKQCKLRTLPKKNTHSAIRYNQRTFKAFLDSKQISICTVEGRKRYPLRIPKYFDKYKHGAVKALRLRYDDRSRLVRAELVVELPPVIKCIPDEPVVLGVDLNINKTAVISNNIFFHSRAIRNVRGRYAYNRQRLQAAGTRSAKRHLKHLSGRERRFQTDVNHCISKAIASMECDAVALEDLNIRKKRRLGCKFNRLLGGWAHAQLERFLEYKLEDLGKSLLKVPPEYTSQRCFDCGNLGIRKKHDFRCPSCGLRLDADLNAARNIAQLGNALLGRLIVNQPIVACDDTGLAGPAEHSYKPPDLLGGS